MLISIQSKRSTHRFSYIKLTSSRTASRTQFWSWRPLRCYLGHCFFVTRSLWYCCLWDCWCCVWKCSKMQILVKTRAAAEISLCTLTTFPAKRSSGTVSRWARLKSSRLPWRSLNRSSESAILARRFPVVIPVFVKQLVTVFSNTTSKVAANKLMA